MVRFKEHMFRAHGHRLIEYSTQRGVNNAKFQYAWNHKPSRRPTPRHSILCPWHGCWELCQPVKFNQQGSLREHLRLVHGGLCCPNRAAGPGSHDVRQKVPNQDLLDRFNEQRNPTQNQGPHNQNQQANNQNQGTVNQIQNPAVIPQQSSIPVPHNSGSGNVGSHAGSQNG